MKFSSESTQKERGRGISPGGSGVRQLSQCALCYFKERQHGERGYGENPGVGTAVLLAAREGCWCSPWVAGSGEVSGLTSAPSPA